MSYRKKDLKRDPSVRELGEALNYLSIHLERSALSWKLVGGFAVASYGYARPTKDLDFGLFMNNLPNVSVKDCIDALKIPNLYRLTDGGYGLKLRDDLIEVDFLDSRLFTTLRSIPKYVWSDPDALLPPTWLLAIKLRTWKARSLRRPTSINPQPDEKDRRDVETLLQFLESNEIVLPTEVIDYCREAIADFVARYPNHIDTFHTLCNGCTT